MVVHNLTVEDAHVFYANGILTHNCDALGLIGQLLDQVSSGRKPKAPVVEEETGYKPFENEPVTDSFLAM
jgi:hypothetical protein